MISAGVSQLELLDEYYKKKQANSTDTQESEENIKEAYEQEALDESEKDGKNRWNNRHRKKEFRIR